MPFLEPKTLRGIAPRDEPFPEALLHDRNEALALFKLLDSLDLLRLRQGPLDPREV